MHSPLWTDLLVPGIPVIEKILRPIVVYFFLVAALRLSGKRELAQLNPFDLVVLLTLSNTVQNAIIGNDNSLLGGIIGATTLMGVNYAVIRILYRHARLSRWLKGEPTVLIEHGRLLQDRLAQEAITVEELTEAARKQGFESLETIERAELDSAGQLVFTPRRVPTEQDRLAEVLAGLAAVVDELRHLRQQLGLA
jgi:uncharacterized membrane protein YcaP (DUF421 family)